MMIYRILNLANNKSYVGQTKFKSLKGRYWGKWYKSTHNKYLKDSVKKYGERNFLIQILEQDISSYEDLDELEKMYIKKYNSLYPHGYNFTTGGNQNHSFSEETRIKIGFKKGKSVTLIDKEGAIHNIHNLKKIL